MKDSKRRVIINDNQVLREQYNFLSPGDIVVGRVSMRPAEEHMLLDLADRGIHLIPHPLSQLASRSKAFQVQLFSQWMPPHTMAIHDQHQLMEALSAPPPNTREVITKQDRKDAGIGVHFWSSLEDVYTQATLGNLPYPFVLQPFHGQARDIRALIVGDYVEAYWRHNPNNFRNNLHFGGQSRPCTLNEHQLELCRQVMVRGRFSYAHLDLMVTEDGRSYLLEINLRGGIRGARINAAEYRQRVDAVHDQQLRAVSFK